MFTPMQSLFHTPPRRRYWPRAHRWLHAHRRRIADPQITRLELAFPGLARELSGLRIAHLSDLHYGLYDTPHRLQRVLALTQALQPDLIAITGDFVTLSPQFIPPVSEMVGRLRARLGVFAVLGNHDFRAGAETLTAALEARGICVLRNRTAWREIARRRLLVAGLDDRRQRPVLRRALGPDAARADFTLLLAHNPLELPAAARAGVHLVLSGHTHGGQVRPRFARPLFDRWAPEGWQRMQQTQMYISRGLGQVIVPFRWGCPPELVMLTLRRGHRDDV